MQITEALIIIGSFCAAIISIITAVEKISKPIKTLSDTINILNTRIDVLVDLQNEQKIDIEASKKERYLIVELLFAITDDISFKSNVNISKQRDNLEKYIRERAH